MKRKACLAASLWLTAICTALAIEPADKQLIPEARAVLDYLESIYGKKTIAALNGVKNVAGVKEASGKEPAIVSFDLSGWNSPTWGKTYTPVVEKTIEDAKAWWARGGIVTMQFHWKHPGKLDGTAWVGKHGKNPPSGPFDMAAATRKGSPAHRQFFDDLGRHADYLQRLADARVPVLWRPFHESEGGWFWWTDQQTPENTAQMWRLMFDFLVQERKLHNLIWVYSAAVCCGKGDDRARNIATRKRFYPGPGYVDIAGIDIYPNPSAGIGRPQDDNYALSFAVMQQVAPGKMLALCECEAIPHPDRLATDGPKWLYCLPWWSVGQKHTAEWVKTTYGHQHFVTLGQLPKWKGAP